MKDILQEIIENKAIEVATQKSLVPQEALLEIIKNMPPTHSIKQALASSNSGIISEFKRRSPSKGWIKESGDPTRVTVGYQAAGASALSILTDINYFGGTLKDIEAARPLVSIPIIRKEFIIDEYQLLEARAVGADAVLLIAAALEVEQCHRLMDKAHELGLEVLLELHNESELKYITPEVDMVGINNRNLGTFHTDVANSYKMAELLPKEMIKVSESGISNPKTVAELQKAGFKGFLIGENFMRTKDPGKALEEFIGGIQRN